MTLIAEVACQKNDDDGSFLIAIYLTKAISQMPEVDEPVAQMDYVMSFGFAGQAPDRKLVIQPLAAGDYVAHYGPILDPVQGDYSTGRLDWDNSQLLYCDPEPAHGQYMYWDSGVTEGQTVMPRYHCLMENGQWWIADVDAERGFGQQVAGLGMVDNPEHLTRNLPIRYNPKSGQYH